MTFHKPMWILHILNDWLKVVKEPSACISHWDKNSHLTEGSSTKLLFQYSNERMQISWNGTVKYQSMFKVSFTVAHVVPQWWYLWFWMHVITAGQRYFKDWMNSCMHLFIHGNPIHFTRWLHEELHTLSTECHTSTHIDTASQKDSPLITLSTAALVIDL